jgi:two-component system phosphate regulon response regulator PhoB
VSEKPILIVDDERDLLESLEFSFSREGFRTLVAQTGKEALALLEREPRPSLVILDLMLPDVSGTEVCRRLRQNPATAAIPVLMLTAKAEELDRVVGFEVGADDYMVKPFSVRELLLRVKAILRRAREPDAAAPELRFSELRVDPLGHRAWVGDEEIVLTALEFRLLTTLMSRRGRVQTRQRLLEDVWEMNPEVTTRTVDTHVLRLRRKLASAGRYIETLRGVGYRFVPK